MKLDFPLHPVAVHYGKILKKVTHHSQADFQPFCESVLLAIRQDQKGWLFLTSPLLTLPEKRKILNLLCDKISCSPEARQFLFVVLNHGRLKFLPEILQAFQQIQEKENGIERAFCQTAQPLTKDEKEKIVFFLQEKTGKNFLIDWEIIPDLIGGLVFFWNGVMIDISVSSALTALKRYVQQHSEG